ncbi:hypothetical protein [Streptomyces sp. PA5.6]|uniref:hypothetical protein n=1 Tax=Streptomyces sp. PA5.6 TaxID=3035651 RepID=UPI00390495AA
MNEATQHPNTPNSPSTASMEPGSYGYCSWHHAYSAGVRVINVVEQASGPGRVDFACLPCREQHHLVPFADRP